MRNRGNARLGEGKKKEKKTMTRRIKMKCGCVVVAGDEGTVAYVIHCSGVGNEVKKDCMIRRPKPPSQEPIKKGEYYPEMPPALPGENVDSGVYLDRLTGDDGTGRVPYDHLRLRKCSMGFHKECSDPEGNTCRCPCHTIHKHVVEALDFCVGMIRDLALGNKNISQVPILPWNHIKKVLAAAKAGL